jgi:hypothetical protein
MSKIITQGVVGHRPIGGKVQCPKCKTVFEFKERDIEVCLTTLAGAKYFYVECPYEECHSDLLIKDNRSWMGRIFDSYVPPKAILLEPLRLS